MTYIVNLFEENCLTQILRSPTHCRGNVLDLLLTDDPSIVKNICIADHYEYIKSDHFAIRFNLDIKAYISEWIVMTNARVFHNN